MKVYVCGRGDIFEKERILKGYAECYISINGIFYCCYIITIEALKKELNVYAENSGLFVNNYTNTIVVKDISDAGIKKALAEAINAGALQGFYAIPLFDLDDVYVKFDLQDSDLCYPDSIISNHVLRYESRLYKFSITKYSTPTEEKRIIGNIYDDSEKLEEIVSIIEDKGYLERYKPYFDVAITELCCI